MTTPRSRRVMVWLAASQAIYALSLLPWLVMAGMAFMAFDAPGSTRQLTPWLMAGAIWAWPLVVAVCTVASWILYVRGRAGTAAWVTSAPLGLLVPAIVVLALA